MLNIFKTEIELRHKTWGNISKNITDIVSACTFAIMSCHVIDCPILCNLCGLSRNTYESSVTTLPVWSAMTFQVFLFIHFLICRFKFLFTQRACWVSWHQFCNLLKFLKIISYKSIYVLNQAWNPCCCFFYIKYIYFCCSLHTNAGLYYPSNSLNQLW